MSNRQIHFENGAPQLPQQPIQTMEELLNSAEKEWKLGHKQEAFVKVLGGMALMSAGVAQAMKVSEAALNEVERLEKIVRLHQEALEETVELLDPDEPKNEQN